MVPKGVRAAQLHVHELARRMPLDDLRAPADRNAVHCDAIIDQRALAHNDGSRRQDLELQPRRRKPLQIPRIGKKREDIAARARQPLFC